jgi:hypothetical protein
VLLAPNNVNARPHLSPAERNHVRRLFRQSVQNGQFLSSFIPALPSHFHDGRASVPGPNIGWGLPSLPVSFSGGAMGIKAGATPQAREAARRASAVRADARAAALAPVIAEIRASGITEPYAIAAALTGRGVPTARGLRFWGAGPVRNLLRRLDQLSGAATLGSQIENRESSVAEKPTAGKRRRSRPLARKALLSPSGLKSALRELS